MIVGRSLSSEGVPSDLALRKVAVAELLRSSCVAVYLLVHPSAHSSSPVAVPLPCAAGSRDDGGLPRVAVLTVASKKTTITLTCSTGSSARNAPRCPDWPPRFRPDGTTHGFRRPWGGSDEDGREELEEFCRAGAVARGHALAEPR